MAERRGNIGNCYEYRADGKRLSGTDRMTIGGMVAYSLQWPETYHQYIDNDGYVTWAKAGREINEQDLPEAVRGPNGREQERNP